MKVSKSFLLSLSFALLAAPAAVNAQTISVQMIGLLDIQGGTNCTVSVFDGNSFLEASSDGTLSPSKISLGTVLDYAFYGNAPAGGSLGDPYAAGSSTGIGTLTSTGGFSAATRQATNVYTTNDPSDPSPTPNFTQQMLTFATTASVGNATIDLSALGASTANPLDIYVILGGFSNNWRVRATDTTTNDTGVLQINRASFSSSSQFVFHITVTDFDTENDLLLTFDGGFNNPTIHGIIVSQILESGSAYDTWKTANAPDSNPDDDTDGDGVTNAVEFVLGGTSATNDLGKLPVAATDGTNMTFTFVRDQASIDPKTALFIETSSDLVTWDSAPSPYTVPDAAVANNPGVTVVKGIPGSGEDTVTLTVPQDSAKKFARLKVVITP